MKCFIRLSLIVLFVSLFFGCSDTDEDIILKKADVVLYNYSDYDANLYINREILNNSNLILKGEHVKRFYYVGQDLTIHAAHNGYLIAHKTFRIKPNIAYSCYFNGYVWSISILKLKNE